MVQQQILGADFVGGNGRTKLNQNFDDLYGNYLPKTGGTLTGALTASVIQKGTVHDIRAYGATLHPANATTAIQAAITAAAAEKGTVFIPPGKWGITPDLISIPKGVSFLGAGHAPYFYNPNIVGVNNSQPTELVALSGGTFMIRTDAGPTRGNVIGNFSLDGANLVTLGLYMDRLEGARVKPISAKGVTSTAFYMITHATTASEDCRDNHFEHLSAELVPIILSLNGNAVPNSNCCHNHFANVQGTVPGPNPAIVINNGDNNRFDEIFVMANAGATGYGLELGARARANYFYHVQLGNNGMVARTPSASSYSNVIFGYDRENGQPAPTLESGAKLSWTEDGTNATGWNIQDVVVRNSLKVNGAGGAAFGLDLSGGTFATGQMKLKQGSWVYGRNFANSGDLQLFYVNNADEFEFLTAVRVSAGFRISDNTNLALASTIGTKIGTAATQKLGFWGNTAIVRPTGWAAMTGTATRTTFATGSITLPQLAERVKALTDDLLAMGLIGA